MKQEQVSEGIQDPRYLANCFEQVGQPVILFGPEDDFFFILHPNKHRNDGDAAVRCSDHVPFCPQGV